MICDNKLIIRYQDNETLLKVEDLFSSMRDYDTFSEFMFSHVLKGNFGMLSRLNLTADIIGEANSIDEIAVSDFNHLFGTKWIDIIHSDIDYNEQIITAYIESHWTPPLAMSCFLSELYEVDITHEAVESSTDKAYHLRAHSLIDFKIEYMTYYEFQYKIKNDIDVLQQLFVFYESFDEFIEAIEKENIFLTAKEHLELKDKYNSLSNSKIENL